MTNFTFGITMLVVGMGGTLIVLFFITLLIHAMVACFPVRPEKPEDGK